MKGVVKIAGTYYSLKCNSLPKGGDTTEGAYNQDLTYPRAISVSNMTLFFFKK